MNKLRAQVRRLYTLAITAALLALAPLSYSHPGAHGGQELNTGRPLLRIEDQTSSLATELVGQAESSAPQLGIAPQAAEQATGLSEDGRELRPTSNPLNMATLPVPIERSEPVALTLANGQTHWYQVVYTPKGGINWVQAAALAEKEGGYLVSIHSEQENQFVFSLVEDPKYWYQFDHGEGLFVLSGPFLGGYQPLGAAEPDGGWRWASGEPWSYERWQKADLDIGINVEPDDQPNNNNGNQNVLAFGEVDLPMSYWSDVPHSMSSYNSGAPSCYGFIIEYNEKP